MKKVRTLRSMGDAYREGTSYKVFLLSILISALAGFLVSIPVTWVVAKMVYENT